MSVDAKNGLVGGLLGTPGRCSIAGAGVSLLLTLLSFAGICMIIIDGMPSFLPYSWAYRWIVEMVFLWCLPFFLVIWRLITEVLQEKLGDGADSRHTQDGAAR